MGVIYLITNPNGRKYVGRTVHIGRRINTYKYRAADPKETKSIVVNSIRKYGWDAHKFEIIEECENELLSEREKFWVKELKTYFFEYPENMNMSFGGEEGGRTWMFDVERRKKQSERFKGEGSPFYGRKHTEENKRKQSERAKKQAIEMGTRVPQWGAEKGRLVVIQPTLCYDKNGDFVKKFDSYTEAAKFIGVKQASRIWESMSGRRSQCSGWHFRKVTENFPLKIDVSGVKNQNVKRPVLTLTSDYEIVCEHPSAAEASEFWGVPKTTINRAAMYNWLVPIRSGHVFIYKDLYEGILAAEAA